MPDHIRIDVISDTSTRPTPEMRQAMAEAVDTTMRAVTYLDVDDADIDRAVAAFAEAPATPRG